MLLETEWDEAALQLNQTLCTDLQLTQKARKFWLHVVYALTLQSLMVSSHTVKYDTNQCSSCCQAQQVWLQYFNPPRARDTERIDAGCQKERKASASNMSKLEG